MIFRIARAEKRLADVLKTLPNAKVLRRPIIGADKRSLWRELRDGRDDLAVSLALVNLLRRKQSPFYPSEHEASALRRGRAKPFVEKGDLFRADTLARLEGAIEASLYGRLTRQRLRWCYRDALLPGADRIKAEKRVLKREGYETRPLSEYEPRGEDSDDSPDDESQPRLDDTLTGDERSGGFVVARHKLFVPQGGDESIVEAKVARRARVETERQLLGREQFALLMLRRIGFSSREAALLLGIVSDNAVNVRLHRIRTKLAELDNPRVREFERKNDADSVRYLLRGVVLSVLGVGSGAPKLRTKTFLSIVGGALVSARSS